MTSGEHYPSASLYVGDLAPEVNEALLFEIFNAVGPVASIRVCRDAVTRRSLGYAYVNFHNGNDAERALDTMNYTSIANRPCRIMWSQRDPSLRKSGKGNIFVKHLDKSIDHKSLFDTFSVFGNILSCKVSTDPATGESLGYGFVHYETDEAAQKAIDGVNGMVIAGQKVEVDRFKSKSERTDKEPAKFTNIFVKNLPTDFTDEKLKETFGKFGAITSSMLAYDAEKVFRGFAFVNFEDSESAMKAAEELNGAKIGENEIFVGRAMKKQERVKVLQDKFEQIKLEKQKKWAGCNLYVKNLAETVTEEQLQKEFSEFGEITSVKIMSDAQGRSRGFGFVCFVNAENSAKALQEMNGKIFEKKPLYVALAQRKEDRRAQLEMQYAHQRKFGAQVPHVFPTGNPMYFTGPQGVPQRPGLMYPPPVANRGGAWGTQSAGMVPPQQPMRGANAPRATPNRNAVPGAAPASSQLNAQTLAAASPPEQKQMIGERLFPQIREIQPRRAGKITGMLLEMDNSDLLDLLESYDALKDKVNEAVAVLEAHERESQEQA